jgi:hypothetical protein
MREASKHQLPLTVMPIHPLRVRPVTGIYRGLRNYPENSYDRTSHAGRFRISGACHWSVTGGIRDPAR